MKKYYPLIDMASDGTIKVPMFPAYDYKRALRTSNFALGKIERAEAFALYGIKIN